MEIKYAAAALILFLQVCGLHGHGGYNTPGARRVRIQHTGDHPHPHPPAHRGGAPPDHSYISPVTYRAKATFNPGPQDRATSQQYLSHQPSQSRRRNLQISIRPVSGRRGGGGSGHRRPPPAAGGGGAAGHPVTYQTYDPRALDSYPPVQAPTYSDSVAAPAHKYKQSAYHPEQTAPATLYRPPAPPARLRRVTTEPRLGGGSLSYKEPEYTNNHIRHDYSRGRVSGSRHSSGRQPYAPHTEDHHPRAATHHKEHKTYYGQPLPRRSYEYTRRRPSRYYDPCINMYEGEYPLNHDFKRLFPYVDNMCYFVKCANKKAYLNPCGPATRNDKKGEGFCSHLDLAGFCGPSLHEYHAKKKEKKTAEKRYGNEGGYVAPSSGGGGGRSSYGGKNHAYGSSNNRHYSHYKR